MVLFAETCVGLFFILQIFRKCFNVQIKFVWQVLNLFMNQYCALVLLSLENHHISYCMHPYIFACIYFVCDLLLCFYVYILVLIVIVIMRSVATLQTTKASGASWY